VHRRCGSVTDRSAGQGVLAPATSLIDSRLRRTRRRRACSSMSSTPSFVPYPPWRQRWRITVWRSVVAPDGVDRGFRQHGAMAHQRGNRQPGATAGCPLQSTLPVVLVAIRHPMMRRWSDELLAAVPGCWTVMQPAPGEMLVDAIARTAADVAVVDTVDFPACCLAALDALPQGHVVVIGPEPDPAYRASALAQGAAAWVSRDRVDEELGAAVRTALGCPHDVCPEDMALPRPSRATAERPATPTGGCSSV
jgi:hypothetical protein